MFSQNSLLVISLKGFKLLWYKYYYWDTKVLGSEVILAWVYFYWVLVKKKTKSQNIVI